MMRTMSIFAVAIMGLCSQALAAPFAPQHVADGSQWVVHLDLEAWRKTELGSRVEEKMLAREAVQFRLAKIKEVSGLDLSKDLKGVTLYSDQYKPHLGVALVYAKVDAKKIAKLLEDKKDYKSSEHGQVTVHSWTARERGKDHPVSLAFAKGNVSVLSSSPAAVLAALKVLDDKSGSIAGQKSPLAAKAAKGSVLLVRADGVSEAKLPARSPLVKQIQSMSLTLGQQKEDSHMAMRIETTDEDVATSIKDIVSGFVAIARLKTSKDKDAQMILDGVEAESSNKVVEISWSAPAKQLLDIIEKRRDEVIRRFRDRGSRGKSRGAENKENSDDDKK